MELPNTDRPPAPAERSSPRFGRDCWSEGDSRYVRVRHLTRYTYQTPVEYSEHWGHLRPVHDWRQRLQRYRMRVTPKVEVVDYEDVFGNFATRFTVDQPYSELLIESESVVELIDFDPFAFARKPINRPKFPIAWMPWERTMLAPYLTPEELPHTQLRSLYDYAMTFVSANKGDIMETLFQINLEMFRNYQYVPGSTCLSTSPFVVMTNRTGVCQDFTNLFITMARLLGIPARYVMGYIYTGNTGQTRAGSDASHAWVQLYIPDIGWKGFDPTNGVLPQQDHIRVAVGRHYRDTSPTTGTLFKGGLGERMTIDVEVAEVSEEE
jgi:transglutaminase-like putative cysteine protease